MGIVAGAEARPAALKPSFAMRAVKGHFSLRGEKGAATSRFEARMENSVMCEQAFSEGPAGQSAFGLFPHGY